MSTESPIEAAAPVRWILRPHQPELPAEPQARDWLSSELETAIPALLRDPHGRPRLVGSPELEGMDVSWSHSGDQLLIAIGRGVQVGADLERVRPRPRALELAQRFFHPAETAWLLIQPEERREQAFIRLWCAKEAVLKAHGRGIAFGLERFQIGDDGSGELRMLQSDPALGPAVAWRLHEFIPLPGYRAALAWRLWEPPEAEIAAGRTGTA